MAQGLRRPVKPARPPGPEAHKRQKGRRHRERLGDAKHAPSARLSFLTVSVGMASIDPAGTHSVQDAIGRADRALYRVKAQGGNRALVEP